MERIRPSEHGVTIAIKVVPNASSTQIAGCIGDRVKVRVNAPPESGKANKAVCALFANVLGVRNKEVSVIAGQTNPMKTIEIHGVCVDTVVDALDL